MIQAWRSFAFLLPIAVVGSTVLVGSVAATNRLLPADDTSRRNRWVVAATCWTALGVLAVTFLPTPATVATPVVWSPFDPQGIGTPSHALLNVGLWIPIGFCASLWRSRQGGRWPLVVKLVATLPIAVEVLQFVAANGRAATAADVLLGTVGVGVGILAGRFAMQ